MKKSSGEVTPEPDVLVMTATPIPRTLALTLYGDLDVSVLDELPPGRMPIVTRRVSDDRANEVWEFVRKQVAAGHQAYVVYPVIEESEENELKAAIKMHKDLGKRVFPELRMGLLHGRMDSDDKESVMRRFQAGEIDVLVSTTVIEVGVMCQTRRSWLSNMRNGSASRSYISCEAGSGAARRNRSVC